MISREKQLDRPDNRIKLVDQVYDVKRQDRVRGVDMGKAKARDDAALRRKTAAPDVDYDAHDPNLEGRPALDYSKFKGREELFDTSNAVDAIYDAKIQDKVKMTPRMGKQAARGELFDTRNAVDRIYETEKGARALRKNTSTMISMEKQLDRPDNRIKLVDQVYDIKRLDKIPAIDIKKQKPRDDAALRRKTDAPDTDYDPNDRFLSNNNRAPAFEFGPPVEYSYSDDDNEDDERDW